MSEKIGNGIGVPFAASTLAGAGSGPTLPDGYYYQLDLIDPRTATGWTLGPNLHNGSPGDTTGYAGPTGAVLKRIGLLLAKAAGMTFDSLTQTPGFAWTLSQGSYFGSNDLQTWNLVTFNEAAAEPPSAGFFQWYPNGLALGNSTPIGPYRYLAWTLSDTGNPCQIGCADIRLRNGVSEVGP